MKYLTFEEKQGFEGEFGIQTEDNFTAIILLPNCTVS